MPDNEHFLFCERTNYAITLYYNDLENAIHYGGSTKETAIRFAFQKLLEKYAETKDLKLVPEISTKNKQGKIITPDGTLKDSIRNDWGYWESKDEKDDINEEIKNKFAKGYPSDNILFEDSNTAVLFQHNEEVKRVDMKDPEALHAILTKFLQYERPEVHDFREAIEHFKQDIPKVTVAIREIIESQQKTNAELQKAQESFLAMAKVSINPDVNADDVKEMMIQHILSADIFNTIFDEAHFHQENNIARELNKVVDTFFTGTIRRQTLGQIKHYYDTINARAASIADHHEKQKFLKVVYENFYKGYNPKAADRLGIVYTPNEIVQFMIRSTDYLLHKHFGKTLGDKNVEILDPATGTGTFICDIIDYLPKSKLAQKYKNELHANEVAILPYYISNLNIEYTYKQKMGAYAEFDNLCFVDTLDNTGFHWVGKQGDLFGVTAENAQRIKRQNERKISVVIGNPPYNANQANENDNNKNREYPAIDKRIKAFYRPFTKQYLYHSKDLIEMPSLLPKLRADKNLFILFSGSSHSKPFQTYATNNVFSFDFLEKTTGLPFYDFTSTGERIDNITDWGLQQFKDHYQPSLRGTEQSNEQSSDEAISNQTTDNKIASSQPNTKPTAPRKDVEGVAEITKEDIFHYTYAVLHNPAYRKKYELNLKREFPRIPFYENFFQWRDWGKQLMNLHINYETVAPFPLNVIARRNDEAISATSPRL